jgi:hypothetical protein
MPDCNRLLQAAERLHEHLNRAFLKESLLEGPDAGVRFNLRAWRFLKSALNAIPWRDHYIFMQTQGYWVLANWMLHDLTGKQPYQELALQAAEAILKLQTPEGSWRYPLPERKHLIATVEGNWGATGLLATYLRMGERQFLEAALRWHRFLIERIGFQPHGPGEAVNYFDRPRGKVPNNSVETAWFFLRLRKVTGDERYLAHVAEMLQFLADVQRPTGELPYVIESPFERGREHYLCFQYNAFQLMKLAWSAEMDSTGGARKLLPPLAAFLEKGVTPSGASAADCFHALPEVDYYTAALGAALHEASRLGVSEKAKTLSERCYARVLARQRSDGRFAYSEKDYGFLRDSRSYPRPEAMTLFHLLLPCVGRESRSLFSA